MLCKRQWTFGFHKLRVIFPLDEELFKDDYCMQLGRREDATVCLTAAPAVHRTAQRTSRPDVFVDTQGHHSDRAGTGLVPGLLLTPALYQPQWSKQHSWLFSVPPCKYRHNTSVTPKWPSGKWRHVAAFLSKMDTLYCLTPEYDGMLLPKRP